MYSVWYKYCTSEDFLLQVSAHFRSAWVRNLLSLVSVENKNKPSAVFVTCCEWQSVPWSFWLPFYLCAMQGVWSHSWVPAFPGVVARKRGDCTVLDGTFTSALLLPVWEAGVRYPVLVVSNALGMFAHPELLLRVKDDSSWIPLSSAGIILAAGVGGETWPQDMPVSCQSRTPEGTHQRHTGVRVLHADPFRLPTPADLWEPTRGWGCSCQGLELAEQRLLLSAASAWNTPITFSCPFRGARLGRPSAAPSWLGSCCVGELRAGWKAMGHVLGLHSLRGLMKLEVCHPAPFKSVPQREMGLGERCRAHYCGWDDAGSALILPGQVAVDPPEEVFLASPKEQWGFWWLACL